MAPRAVTRGELRSNSGSESLAVSIDWLAFTCYPASSSWTEELKHFLRANFSVEGWDVKRGWNGYECSARVGGCIVAWGGEGQGGTVHVEVPGSVCALCGDWFVVAEWLELMQARITRVDIAGDDFSAERLSIKWAIRQWRGKGFSPATGPKPKAQLIDDFGSGDGQTFYVGKRENGKLARVYEKGRQLGDKLSKWVRFEVEWRAKDRVLSLDMLRRPGAFLAGAFPCVSFFADVAEKVRTFKERARISYQRAIEIARLHAGRVVNAILAVSGGDIGEVVTLLRRSGLPARMQAPDIGYLTMAQGSV